MKRAADNVLSVMVLCLSIATIAFLVTPLLIATVMSFDARQFLGQFPPPSLSLQWYVGFFSDAYYLKGLQVSLMLALAATTLSTLVGVAAAFTLDRYDFPGKEPLSAFFLSPLVVPHVIIGFSLLLFFSTIGVFSGPIPLIGGHLIITVPYVIRTTLASLVGIRKSLTEAALSLGATERRAFWKVTVPLSKTGIAAGAVFAFAYSIDDVSVALFLTGPNFYTLPVAMTNMMLNEFDLRIAAAAVCLMVLTIALIWVLDCIVGLDKVIGQGVYHK
ncbi:ABC transporter permease subunit [Bradyrhizobium sp. CSA112]|uniref:ABC transporter permease n=1 Tax=Bradyrhizobium sp. CSA112 TaxID=2699170 RepID=UPI0023B1D9B2|nr:ABC transporter permease [Bradyrhizobium sp. CSA112]MDE5458941.1 ABC transporter permease subunit [Bradyrhizobium sp. CSA112]